MSLPKLIVLILVSAAPIALAGCAHSRFDPVAEGKALLQRDAEWATTAAAGKDVDKIVSYWSDDAVVIEPGEPIHEGKAAIRTYVTNSLKTPGFRIHWDSEDPVFSGDGSMAYMRGTDVMTMPGADGKLVTLHT
ncbi:YybH family protein [Rhodanobacter lindaniclasticus]